MATSHHHRVILSREEIQRCIELLESSLNRLRYSDDGFHERYMALRKLKQSARPSSNSTWRTNLQPDEHWAITSELSDWTDVLPLRSEGYDQAYALYLKVKNAKTYSNSN